MTEIALNTHVLPPVVECDKCKVAMRLCVVQPVLYMSDLSTAHYHCDKCGAEAKREIRQASY